MIQEDYENQALHSAIIKSSESYHDKNRTQIDLRKCPMMMNHHNRGVNKIQEYDSRILPDVEMINNNKIDKHQFLVVDINTNEKYWLSFKRAI